MDLSNVAGARITGIDVVDLRFPTSRQRAGSDAMNVDPDYSAAYRLGPIATI